MRVLHARFATALAVTLAVAGVQAQTRQDDAPEAVAATAAASAASAAKAPAADPTAPKPFAQVTKGAQRSDGLFPVWRKDEKVWIELPREMVGKPFLFTANIARSIGERRLYASQMGISQMAQFRIIGRQVQLIALNTAFRAESGEGNQRAVEEAFSPSLIASSAVASAPEPRTGAVLVDASFLFIDAPSYSTFIEAAYRLPYAIDKSNSSIEHTRADGQLTSLTARLHFATPRIPAPPLVPPTVPSPTPPQTTPDPRSFFVDYVYSFMALPEKPMAPRLADPRLGHFTESFTDFGTDMKANPRVHYVTRWRLEKKDPQAAVSEPVKPITFWLDRNIPPKYRPAIAAGVLEWNKAFERIGFRNAVVVKQQPDDADWDDMDAGHASIRWFVGADVGFAIGPSQTDPRTGEILDADIGMSDVFARSSRRALVEDIGGGSASLAGIAAGWRPGGMSRSAYYCADGLVNAMEMEFALDLLEAREEIAPDSPEAEAFVMATIKQTIMHEVGHVLGLKHNFKASTAYSLKQLQDRRFTESNGVTASVMDYTPVNLALKGEPQGSYHHATLGAYDYWAIEYAYKPIDRSRETSELSKIASRSTEPLLAYADDADAGGGPEFEGMDPAANRFDLGNDPLAFYKRRFVLSQELWTRVNERSPREGDDPMRQRRALMSGFRPLAAAAELGAKFVGGMDSVRDLPGTTQRAAWKPVDPARQRQALDFLAKSVFSADSFRFPPQLLSNLTVDYNEWQRGGPADIAGNVASVQSAALNRLMSPGTAKRLLDLPQYLPERQRKGVISLGEVYETLQQSIWSELRTGGEIDRLRRNLQREHVKRLQVLLTKGAPGMPADAISVARYEATKLESQLRSAVAKNQGSVETRAHLAESLSMVSEALHAKMQRG